MELETYCALCGVPFDVYPDLYRGSDINDEDVAWTKYFIALRKMKSTEDPGNETWFLSGIGEIDGSEGFQCSLPSSSYDARLKIQPSDSSSCLATGQAYKDCGTDEEVVYPMHPACWKIFLQIHALLAKRNPLAPDLGRLGHIFARSDIEENGRGLVPEWAGDYAGPEQFWDDGWAWNDDIDTSVVAGLLEEKPEWDFLVSDPGIPHSSDWLFQDPPVVSSTNLNPSPILLGGGVHDIFSLLPEELLLEIICFLPTASVRDLRLASKTMASARLGTNFWRSRFAYPNELCHIRLPPSFPRESKAGTSIVDWQELCYRLLHPLESEHADCQENRERIVSLTSKLVHAMLSEDSKPGQMDLVDDLVCHHSFSCSGQRIANTTSGIIPTSTPLTISATFRRGKGSRFLSGLAFSSPDSSQQFGFNDHSDAKSTIVGESERLMGFAVALTAQGIVGISLIIRKKDGTRREKECGDFEGNVGKGFLLPARGRSARGLTLSLAQNRRIVAIGILEKKSNVSNLNQNSLIQSLWHPELPPLNSTATPAMGHALTGNYFSYRCLTTFGDNFEAMEHLAQIDAYMDTDSLIHGFRFHFDDRKSTPTDWIPGKAIPCVIDGPGGERINGIEVLSSDTDKIAGLNMFTNRGHFNFATANFSSADLKVEHYNINSEGIALGIFGETEVQEDRHGPYQNFGLLYSSYQQMYSPKSSRKRFAEEHRGFDDHMNSETSRASPFPSSSRVRIGESIGTQPNHGFSCFMDLREEIKSITVCLGSRSPGFAEMSHDLVGIKVEFRHDFPRTALLGRCIALGPTFEIPASDRVVEVEIGLIQDGYLTEPQTVNEILFTTRQGITKGFRGNKIIDSSISRDHRFVMKSSGCLELIGLTWSLDLRQSLAADHGIEPHYILHQKTEDAHTQNISIQKTLYPSQPWMHSISPSIRPRPVPAKEGNHYPVAPLLLPSPSRISSIRVFFNSFLQGISFTLSTGEIHSIGNLLGAYQDFVIEKNEYILCILLYQRHQTTIRTQLPGDILSTEGVQFCVCRWVDVEAHVRHSPYMGPQKPFGPYMNEQRGLWNANRGGSARWAGCFPLKVTRITIQSGTSFAGMYLESSSTHVRRAGALVSDEHGLPEWHEYPILQQLRGNPMLAAKELPSDHIDKTVPYLGAPPPASYIILPNSGRAEGTYRIWCRAPSSLCRIITYRHLTRCKFVVIGLEFIPRDGGDKSALLGHRSVWMEHAVELEVGEGAEVERFEVAGQHEAERGVEDIKIIISQDRSIKGSDGDKRARKVVGFHAYVGEFIEGIGTLEEAA